MKLQEKLMEELKAAMKSKDSIRLNTIRMVRGQMKDKQIDKGDELTPEEEVAVLMNAAKKRKEAIEMYEQGGRQDLLEKEQKELEIISEFLPEQLSEEEIKKVVVKAIAETGATSMKEMGAVMKHAMAELKGKADGKVVQQIVKEQLS